MLYDVELTTRLLQGTAGYPSNAALREALANGQPDLITLSLRRQDTADPELQEVLKQLPCPILPNTAGCSTAKEAITTAHMARELFDTPRIKLEVIGHEATLQPDPFGLVEAAKVLCAEGFQVFPYTTEDLVLGEALLNAGCQVLMPWASPIGSGQGLRNIGGLVNMRQEFSNIPLVIDAGIRTPCQAAQAMELGFDAVLLNTAVARSGQPSKMAQAFRHAVQAGRLGYEAGLITRRETAKNSTPSAGLAEFASA